MIAPEDILQEGLILRAWGWSVFPLTASKTPRVKWAQFQTRRPTDRELGRLFSLKGVGGIGVICGRISGTDGASLVVRDFDEPADFDNWRASNPRLAADTPTVVTRRGRHVYLRCRRSVSWRRLPHGELIADSKHYAVVPPSKHPSGHEYRWEPFPPFGPSDFPLVSLKDSGFIPGKSQKTQKRAEENLNALCQPPHPAPGVPFAIREAVLRTLPDAHGKRNHRIHQFARQLKDILPGDAPAAILFDAMQLWWSMALPVIGTKDFGPTLQDFRRAWAAVQVPISQSRPMRAARLAVAQARDDRREMILAAARSLANLSADGTFHLSCRTAGKQVGVSHEMASRHLAALVISGQLIVVEQGLASARKRRATVFRMARSESRRPNWAMVEFGDPK